jgi:hypothetical protein
MHSSVCFTDCTGEAAGRPRGGRLQSSRPSEILLRFKNACIRMSIHQNVWTICAL